jgi:hypothetical protein
MAQKVPTLKIESPQPNAIVGTKQFTVTGLVTAPGMPEPVTIYSVSVQVDAQPAVKATLKHLPDPDLVEVTFSATVQITGGQDPHTVTVSVASDAGAPVSGTVTVTAGLRLVAPAVLIDVATDLVTPGVGTINLQSQLSMVARKIAALPQMADVQSGNKMVVGPMMLQMPAGLRRDVAGDVVAPPNVLLRLGLWILDLDFPAQELIQPTSDFPLPQLTPEAAAGCFGLAPC